RKPDLASIGDGSPSRPGPAIMGNPMPKPLDPFRFVLVAVAGWMNHQQLQVIDYLREENRILREQLGGRRLRLSDDPRRPLAARAKVLGRAHPHRTGYHRHTGNTAGLAPKADRAEVRWQCSPLFRSTANARRNRSAGRPDGSGKPRLGLRENPRCALQPRA